MFMYVARSSSLCPRGVSDKMDSHQRIVFVLGQLEQGISRDNIASSLGLKQRACLDQFMRNHSYIWDKYQQTYVKQEQQSQLNKEFFRLEEVRRLFRRLGPGRTRVIAERMGFSSAKEMNEFAEKRGFYWSEKSQNYERKDKLSQTKVHPGEENLKKMVPTPALVPRSSVTTLPIKNHDSSTSNGESPVPPRYIVKGIHKPKNLTISDELDSLIKDCCKRWDMTGKDFFQLASVECLKRYGYEQEVSRLIDSSVRKY